jgi:hypothetical protein
MHLNSLYKGPLWRAHRVLNIALHRGLYLSIIMDRYEGTYSALNIALHRGLYLSVIMDRYGWPHSVFNVALH